MKALFGVVLLLVALAGLADLVPKAISPPVFADSAQVSQSSAGAQEYAAHCAICHGDQRQGILPGFPPLAGVLRQFTNAQIFAIVHNGKGRMPAFPSLGERDVASLIEFLSTDDLSAAAHTATGGNAAHSGTSPGDAGKALFQQNCAFCHGRDTTGGESGPDLTRSKLVLADVKADRIAEVVRNGFPGKMPAFNFSEAEILSVAAFIHAQQILASGNSAGNRKGVDVSDLQTGNAEAGKTYFNGAGGCSTCHSPTGDLAGIATRYQGLALEEQMLYPKHPVSHVTVTLASGQKITGPLAYQDEFTIGLRDGNGTYHSWSVKDVQVKVDNPVEAHVEQFSKYTDADIHNLMAYIQTMR